MALHDSKYARLVPPLVVDPVMAEAIGLNESIFVQQLLYWLNNAKVKNWRDGRKWVYNTYGEWREQFPFWSVSTIKRIVLRLEKSGIVLSTDKYNKAVTDRTKWYTVDAETLDGFIKPVAERVKMERSTGQVDPLEDTNLPHSDQRLPENTQKEPASQEQFEELFVIES